MDEKKNQDVYRKLDNLLDIYFDELANRIERKKDILSLRGWLRVNLHYTVTDMHSDKEAEKNRNIYNGIIILLILSVLNMVLLFFRYLVDPV